MNKKKYYKVLGVNTDVKQLVVADNYANAVSKLMGLEDFDYLFGEGFTIYPEGEIIV